MFIVIGKRRVKVCYKIRSRSDHSGLFLFNFLDSPKLPVL